MTRHPWQGRRGTTLVELLVCLALLGVFSTVALALVRPLSAWYDRTRRLARARVIADTIVEELRGELLYAEGTLRLAEAAAGDGDADRPFLTAQPLEGAGSALEFRRGGAYLLLDAGAVPETRVPAQDTGSLQPARAAGYLHKRYYRVRFSASDDPQPYYLYRNRDPTGVWYQADACTDAYAEGFYMGNVISLRFAVADTCTDETGAVRATSLSVEVTVARGDTGDSLCSRRAVLDLPLLPVLLHDASLIPGREGTAP